MKKLIVAVAIVCVAAMSQAGTVTWGSGAIYTAASASGGWSTTTAMSASQLVTMNVFLVDDAAEYATIAALDQAGIYEWSKSQTADYTANNYNTAQSKYIGAITAKDTSGVASKAYNSIVVAEYTDSTLGKSFYMATAATATANQTGTAQMPNLLSNVANWQTTSVPEPTSGLLMLLGIAGLALRRKCA